MAFAIEWFLGFLNSPYGLLGLFVACLAGNATIFFPAPVDLLIFLVGTIVENPTYLFAAAIVSAFGAAAGEMSAYILGLLGVKTLEKMKKKQIRQVLELGESLAKKGLFIIFLGALTPFPFDLIGIAAGVIRYNPKYFFAAAFAGKAVRYLIIIYAGFLGAASIKAWFFIG